MKIFRFIATRVQMSYALSMIVFVITKKIGGDFESNLSYVTADVVVKRHGDKLPL